MVECNGKVQELPPATSQEGWRIKKAAQSGIPFVEDGSSGKRLWCMEVFQSSESGSDSAGNASQPPDLDLGNIVASDDSSGPTPKSPAVPTAAMTGLTVGLLT